MLSTYSRFSLLTAVQVGSMLYHIEHLKKGLEPDVDNNVERPLKALNAILISMLGVGELITWYKGVDVPRQAAAAAGNPQSSLEQNKNKILTDLIQAASGDHSVHVVNVAIKSPIDIMRVAAVPYREKAIIDVDLEKVAKLQDTATKLGLNYKELITALLLHEYGHIKYQREHPNYFANQLKKMLPTLVLEIPKGLLSADTFIEQLKKRYVSPDALRRVYYFIVLAQMALTLSEVVITAYMFRQGEMLAMDVLTEPYRSVLAKYMQAGIDAEMNRETPYNEIVQKLKRTIFVLMDMLDAVMPYPSELQFIRTLSMSTR